MNELILSQITTYWLSSILALWALSRHFHLSRLFAGLVKLRFDRDIISFAIPHSINMSLSRYLMRLDVIMLGAYGVSAQMLGLYGIASLIVNEMRQARMIFAYALAPVTARYRAANQREELELVFNRVSRWTTSIIVPLSFVVVVMRNDLLRLVNASYTGDTHFMALLMIVPLLGCAFGLAGNCILYTGHSRWNLFNNVAAAALATVFNMLFIPYWKLLGAAISAALAALIASVLQLWELAKLEGVCLRMHHIYHPYVAFAFAVFALIALWDPAQLPSFWLRAIVAVAFFISIIGIMAATGHPELKTWIARRYKRR